MYVIYHKTAFWPNITHQHSDFVHWFVEVNECDSSPCLNGGTCVNGNTSYSCACLVGYTDPECSSGALS